MWKLIGHTEGPPMATPVKVYGPPMSTAVSRVLACLLEKDVNFQLIPVDMSKGEHKKPDYLKIQVPSLYNYNLSSLSVSLRNLIILPCNSPSAKSHLSKTRAFPSLVTTHYPTIFSSYLIPFFCLFLNYHSIFPRVQSHMSVRIGEVRKPGEQALIRDKPTRESFHRTVA